MCVGVTLSPSVCRVRASGHAWQVLRGGNQVLPPSLDPCCAQEVQVGDVEDVEDEKISSSTQKVECRVWVTSCSGATRSIPSQNLPAFLLISQPLQPLLSCLHTGNSSSALGTPKIQTPEGLCVPALIPQGISWILCPSLP